LVRFTPTISPLVLLPTSPKAIAKGSIVLFHIVFEAHHPYSTSSIYPQLPTPVPTLPAVGPILWSCPSFLDYDQTEVQISLLFLVLRLIFLLKNDFILQN
jgi:hypothetical protein